MVRILLTTGDAVSVAQVGVDEYEAGDIKFRELLCLLIILTCGQSGRGTEIYLTALHEYDGIRKEHSD